MEISVEVRTIIREAKNRITTCKIAEDMLDVVSQVANLLTCSDHENAVMSSIGIRYNSAFRKEFLDNHFSHFCEHVLRYVDPRFFDEEKSLDGVFRSLFVEGPADLSFLVLASSLSSIKHTTMLHKIVSILDYFVSDGKFVELFFSQCLSTNRKNSSQDLLLLLVTLPDKLANKMKLSLNAKFHPNSYYKILGNELLKSLIKIHQVACGSTDYTTSFLSQFIGKVALRGSVDVLLDMLLPQFKTWSYTSPLWSNLCSQTLMGVQESALEPVVETLLRKITFYPFFSKLLKDYIHKKCMLNLLLTHKFLFIRYYNQTNILQNIIGYLCGAGRRHILMETLQNLLSHWGNSNTLKHSPYPQHLYITQAVILSVVQANNEEIAEHKQELLHKLLSGVQAHLESPNSKIRQLGMITAECVTACLNPAGQKLQFEYKEDEEVKGLKMLASSPKFGTDMEKENFMDKPSMVSDEVCSASVDGSSRKVPSVHLDLNGSSKVKQTTNSNDDDDLQPYDINEEDHDLIEGIHPPRYVSECIDGFLSTDDPKRYIASLRVVKKIIMNDQDNLHHLSVQLVTVLLHLQDKYSVEDYCQLRFSGMVAATVSCPLPVADYLTKQFYAPNYSLRQRMDILDVLAAAVAELSRPATLVERKDQESHSNIPRVAEVKNWQMIIQQRVEKKTKRFGKKISRTNPKAAANRFAPVAGHFFFPLLQGFDSRQNTFDLLGEDCMVLGCLVCTVGNIMYCASGAAVARNMARSMLEFVWVLRYHNDSYVRQALLFALAMVILSVSDYFLVNEMQEELLECQNWLENILSNDPSAECRKLALQVLVSVGGVFKRQFNPGETDF